MTLMNLQRQVYGAASAIFLAAIATSSHAETMLGTTVESRVLLGFKVDDGAISQMLPDGWVAVTLPQGPVAGSNLILALIDRHVILDAEGNLGNPSSGPTVAFLVYGRKEGVEGVRSFVTRVYEEPPVVDPYGNSVSANIDRVSGYSDSGSGDRTQSEVWTVQPEDGGELRLELDHKLGRLMWSTGGESRPFSSENPDFFRIYRYDQLAGLAMNSAMGVTLDGTVSFSASGSDVDAIFDGSEALVSIVTIPTYIREIWLP